MWQTIFVIDGNENVSDKDFPAFQPGGKLLLYMKDTFSGARVPVGFTVNDVFYDLYAETPRQYVHMSKTAG